MAPWPEPSWKPVEPFPFAEAGRPFTGTTRDQQMLSIAYYERPDKSLAAVASFGPRSEGAPGQAHGGAILTVLDEALGAAAWNAGHHVLTARLTTEFRKSVPVPSRMIVETRIVNVRHRIVFVEGELQGEDGVVYAQADGRFIVLQQADHQRIFGGKR
jgi:acyl-coenzyme A thioesterase PaaI-like protein